jgi:hypothetical protein
MSIIDPNGDIDHGEYTVLNPLWFAGYRIYRGDYMPYDFVHGEITGAPDGNDWRRGTGTSIADCKAQIKYMEQGDF